MAKIGLKAALLGATILAVSSLVMPAWAQNNEESKEQDLATEDQRYWKAAEVFYRRLLEKEPGRSDLWQRLAEILVEQGDRDEDAAEAFARAADLAPDNASLQAEAASSYSVADQPRKAFSYIARAIQIEPNNPEYWNSRSVLEAWLDDYVAAEKSMQRAFANGLPRNEDTLVRLATLQQWQGKLKESAAIMEEVIERYGGGEVLFLNLARLYSYRGDYVTAIGYIENYKEAGGDELDYAREKSLYLAWADRPNASKAIVTPALVENPDDPNLLISNAIANQRARDFKEMEVTLDHLDRVTGPNAEAKELRRILTADSRSNADARFMASTDRDDIDIIGGSLTLTYAPRPGTYFRVGGESYYLSAPSGSGLDRNDNNDSIVKSAAWVEVEAPLSDNVWGSVLVGETFTDFGPDDIKLNTQLHVRANDKTTVTFGYSRDLFTTSPRTLSLGIVQNEAFINTVWTPGLKWYIEARGSYLWLNDTNEGGTGELTVIRQIIRRDKVNMDLGFNGTWISYDKDLPNGYYDPSFMQRYFVPIYFYFKFNDDDGLSVTVSPGVIKDNNMDRFKFAGVVSMEYTYGLHRDWMLKANVSAYIGGSGSAIDPNISNYFFVGGGLRLVRRF